MSKAKTKTPPAGAKTATPKVTGTIMDVWTKSEGTKRQEELDANLEMLQADAEQVLTKNKRNLTAAKRAATNAMEAAAKADSPNFRAIVDAQLAVEEAELERDHAIATYKSLFGCNPMISVK